MMRREDFTSQLLRSSGITEDILTRDDVAHLFIHHNRVVGLKTIPGLTVDTEEEKDSVKVDVVLKEGVIVEKPVHMCFGLMGKDGIQQIIMNVVIQKNSSITILSHCTFPNAINVQHIMDAKVTLEKNARYAYFERHVHGKHKGIQVYPKTVVHLQENARFKTDFELLKGRVGVIDIDYEVFSGKKSVFEMNTRISGTYDDIIKIKETGHLNGDYAHGVLLSRVAVRDEARAEVYSKLTASGAYARGHVDCKEIVQDDGMVSAIPIVEVSHPKAHVTHEAALGSVDSKQLQTLMARGLTEEEATDLIIQGLLK